MRLFHASSSFWSVSPSASPQLLRRWASVLSCCSCTAKGLNSEASSSAAIALPAAAPQTAACDLGATSSREMPSSCSLEQRPTQGGGEGERRSGRRAQDFRLRPHHNRLLAGGGSGSG